MPGTYIYPLKRIFLNLSGGTVTGDTVFTQGVFATRLSGGTIYSGSTDLSLLITQIIASATTSAPYLPLSGGTGGQYFFTGNTTGQTLFVQNDILPTVDNNSNLGTLPYRFHGLNVVGITANTITASTIDAATILSGAVNIQSTFNSFNFGINLLNTQILTKANRSGDTFTGSVFAPAISATTVSGGTLFSGSTNLYSIFQPFGSPSTQVQNGTNTYTGGTIQFPSVNIVDSPSFNSLFSSGSSQLNIITATSITGGTVSGGTIFSGSTNLQNVFNSFNNQLGTKANLSGATFTGGISASAITDTFLVSGRAVYVGPGGLLKADSGFTYDDVSSLLFAQNIQIGSSSLSGNVTIWGNVNVMGQAISAFTSTLLIEDNNISLNYNPTASTVSTSLGAGFTIQDGSGLVGTDVVFDIRGTLAGIDNRSFTTNLNDIRVRESGTTISPNGARLLAEGDFLDAGFY